MIASVRHITKHHAQIRAEPGYGIALFTMKGQDIEAIVTALDGSETILLRVEAPHDQAISTSWSPADDGATIVNIYWTEK
jgi:predicted RNA methylase